MSSGQETGELASSGAPDIDGYTIERVVGRGATAIVYLARELKHGRMVALKVLKTDLSASLHAERFLREIEIIAGLSHPNILPLLDSGRTGERLYYVTPYVPGESLRSRLERERQLGFTESVGIVREVAEALDFAHRHGVVHRDIKPENILLADGHAVVADFGIARALSLAGDPHLTAPGLVVGTAPYMSPEQAGGETEIDGRSDVYALGCVLYELLAGVTPFVGVTSRQILTQHLTAAVPSLRAARPTVSHSLEQAVLNALAKVPADRYATARSFSEALAASISGAHVAPTRRASASQSARWVAMAAIGVIALAGTMWATTRGRGPANSASAPGAPRESGATASGPDTTRYVVLSADSVSGDVPPGLAQRLGDALERWSGVAIADEMQVRDTVAARRRRPFADRDARSIALAFGAGRYIRSQGTRAGDSVTVRAALYDTHTDARLADAGARVAASAAGGDSTMATLADDLLFRGRLSRDRAESPSGTRSLPARQAYLEARAAVEQWDLSAADSLLLLATRLDPQYARASLWLARLRSWRHEQIPRWRFAAERADAGGSLLDSSETLLARALLALARAEHRTACPLFARLAARHPTDFAAWYGLGNCLRDDHAVVRDARSPSGWRFRTSYGEALAAYQQAFQLLPAIHRSFRGGSFLDVQEILMTSTTALRRGSAVPPDTMQFLAYPAWQGDSLAFTPFPETEFAAGRVATRGEAVNAAIRQQRKRFHTTATMWRAALPQSAAALEAVAVSLDLLGNAAAFDTLRMARRLAVDEDDRLRMGTLEVWMRVKFSAPSDAQGLREARRLADSLLGAHRPTERAGARQLASLAALLGRAGLASTYTRMAEAQAAPAAIAQTAPALLAFAALGGPVDSLRALEPRVNRAIRASLAGADQETARAGWLLRAAFLAVPEYRFESIASMAESPSIRAKLLVAWRTGDVAGARATLATLKDGRRRASVRAFDVTTDALYPEAAILASLGDTRGAIGWLGPGLDSLSLVEPQALSDVARAGSLMRAMTLRAELADRVGDRLAARAWATAVLALWSEPDDFLRPVVRRLQQIAH